MARFFHPVRASPGPETNKKERPRTEQKPVSAPKSARNGEKHGTERKRADNA